MNTIQLAGKFAGILSSSTILIIGTIVLLKSMTIDYDSVIYACTIAIPGAIVTGFAGYFIGKIFENAHISKDKHIRHKHKRKDPDLLIDDLLVNDLNNIPTEIEE